MPKRTDISSILVVGAGPIVIGQACEFDYSGAQACKALKAEGYRVILINSNPATIMTDPDVADATYIEPITPEFVERIIAKEKPDAILPTVGGQTALNCSIALFDQGILQKYHVEMIGASREAIEKAENRERFKQAMDRIGLESPQNVVVRSLDDARNALAELGLPAIIRPSFTLGGAGGGIAYNKEEFEQIVTSGLEQSPTHEVQIDRSLLGWKEFEMEVVRDKADNCIIVCSIENIDPMGVHTGDSVTVAPALTLTDKEYQRMRDASIAVLREIGVDTGGSNVQFAVCPDTGKLIVIEMNPRVSRSSALASKATGFPIAKVAAKLAIGYTLDEILNDCTKITPASFEPSIDYVVTKIPRFTFEKFKGSVAELSSSMKSVGEAMAIGRSFKESLQKALRSMETGLTGLNPIQIHGLVGNKEEDHSAICAALAKMAPDRLLTIAEAFRNDFDVEEIYRITKFDRWFLRQIEELVAMEQSVKANGLPKDHYGFLALKKAGFSDAFLAKLIGKTEQYVRKERLKCDVKPVYKRIDTCAAEFACSTSYMYGCYEGDGVNPAECESAPSDRKKVVILGGGPNRIGQGIEFDYCCVQAAYALKDAGYETIMVNCNPETVSTDYDTSDRLYFEPLTQEDVLSLLQNEMSNGTLHGVVVQYGGQTPLKLAAQLEANGIPIIGTSPHSIDLAEDRDQFKKLLDKLKLKQPANDIARSPEEMIKKAQKMGYPLVVRPSYVLGGRAMDIIYDQEGLENYIKRHAEFFANGPLLLDHFLTNAAEVDVDAICDQQTVYIAGVMEHIEEAGIHSGDSACSLPPHSLDRKLIEELKNQTRKLAMGLGVKGLMNVQFAIKDGIIYVLEVNPRASRTVPFVAKVTGVPVAKIAARVMAGESLASFNLEERDPAHVAVKEAVFPFGRFPGVDVLLGPEMKSTGEVMGIDYSFDKAFAKSQLACNTDLPLSGTVFISVKESDKEAASHIAAELIKLGFQVVATRGTAQFLQKKGLEVTIVNKVLEGRPHIVDRMKDGQIDLVINTTEGAQAIADSFSIRRTALSDGIPYSTTISGAEALLLAIKCLSEKKPFAIESIQTYFAA